MRILLAVDGSRSSDRAVELLSTVDLGPGSSVRVVAVDQPDLRASAMSWGIADVDPTGEDRDVRHLRRAVEEAERCLLLSWPGLRVESEVVRGRPGSSIIDEAARMHADLVVVGSRGHGRIETMVLGSTAAEVVDHAPCPVLVARRRSLDPVVLAYDDSASSREAKHLLGRWPLFAGRAVTVVSVAKVPAGATPAYAGRSGLALESYGTTGDGALPDLRRVAREVAERLGVVGIVADIQELAGDPATELVRYAGAHDTGTIVMGTRGHTGLTRLLLGSTARNVLLHAPCSVLVVRQPR